MLERAKIVLDDCRGALDDFKEGLQGEQWRRHFVLCVTLLRAVGNVLEKIDTQHSEALKNIIKLKHEDWKKVNSGSEIYWEFIKKDRDLILKEYQINAGQSVTIKIGEGKSEYSYPYYGKAFQGKDQRELIKMAIEWWEECFKSIEDQYLKIGK
jgi:hypothetical protein